MQWQQVRLYYGYWHTEQFKVYDVEDGKIVSKTIVDTEGQGHGALAGLLTVIGADILICGGIGGGAQMALAEAGIKLYGGVSGSCDAAVEAYLANNLGYNPNVRCDHHDNEHSDGGHNCGDHGCYTHNCGGHSGH